MVRVTRSKIDEHVDRGRIEYDLARGVPVRSVAKKYGLSKDACYRQLQKLPPQLKAAQFANLLKPGADLERLRIDESEGLLANLAMQRARLLLAQDAAMDREDGEMMVRTSAQVHKNLELVGRYLGEFAQRSISTQISVLISPEYLKLRAALVQALRPFPEARMAVAAVLHRIEGDVSRSEQATVIEGAVNAA
jgi:hypothetical protein